MEIRDIKTAIRLRFDPLAHSLGLKGPNERVHNNVSFSFGYFADDIGLELRIELSDFFIYALIFKAEQGEIPSGYKNNLGERQKLYFQEALKELSLGGEMETKELQRLGGDHRNCEEMASKLAGLIKDKWASIYAQKKRLFS